MSDDIAVDAVALTAFAAAFLAAKGAPDDIAAAVAAHLVEADLRGVASHGTMRLCQYADWIDEGHFEPAGRATLDRTLTGAPMVDGGNGYGIPAMLLAVETGVAEAQDGRPAVVGVTNVGHTGRIGAFAEWAAEQGCFALIIGGGGREMWRQVAPFGGARAMLPTNPYTFALPGGEDGPVVVDFATSAAAGGKIYAARYAGRPVPEGLLIDAEGRPTTDPEAYVAGGAILPMAGPKGYGMALIAELLCGAMLGTARHGMNWVCLLLDIAAFRAAPAFAEAAEACLTELRACPPAPGFDAVEIPGERERRIERERRLGGVPLPRRTLGEMRRRAETLGVDPALIAALPDG